MVEIDVKEALAHFEEYLSKVNSGERVVIRDGSAHRFELKQIDSAAPRPLGKERQVGAGVGQGTIHPSFYDPLPEDILAYFEGRGEDQEDPQK